MVGDGDPTLPGLKGLEWLTLGPLGSVHCQPQSGASLLRPHVGCRSQQVPLLALSSDLCPQERPVTGASLVDCPCLLPLASLVSTSVSQS